MLTLLSYTFSINYLLYTQLLLFGILLLTILTYKYNILVITVIEHATPSKQDLSRGEHVPPVYTECEP